MNIEVADFVNDLSIITSMPSITDKEIIVFQNLIVVVN